MNKNLLVGLFVTVLIGIGFVIVSNTSKTQAPTQNNQDNSQTPEQSTINESPEKPAGEAMEKGESEVTLTGNGFQPNSITVGIGDKVVWKNQSGASATVDSAQHPTHLIYPKMNLGGFQDGETHELVFDEAGSYNYHNHLDPSATGTVVVE